MRIASIETYVHTPLDDADPWFPRKPLAFVRLLTDHGLVGWGEIHPVTHRIAALCSLVRSLGEGLIGWPVHNIKAMQDRAFNAFGEQRIGMEGYSAASAIEIAAWDALAQEVEKPVHALMGGCCHDAIPLYANIYSRLPRSPTAMAARAGELAERGFGAIKFYPFVGGVSLADGVEKVRAVREAVGSGVELGVDLWRHTSPASARAICRALEPFDIAFVEDPLAPIDARNYADLRAQATQPLVTGETLVGKYAFRELLEHRAVDILNPDVCAVGGILEMREIAAMAEVFQVRIAPHAANSMTIGLAATAHAAAGMPNLYRCEYFPEWEADLDAFCDLPLRAENGALALPTRAGLGIRLNATSSRLTRID